MKSFITEFSYGYAVTEEIMSTVRQRYPSNIIAPAFPSLYDEGRDGGGYDVRINNGGVPIFLQFKLSSKMLRASAREIKIHKLPLSVPFYRMKIWSRIKSIQHGLLLRLEENGNRVFYIAPAFANQNEFISYYATQCVIENSFAFSPSAIGPITDDDEHYVSYQMPGPGYFCSEPKFIAKYESSEQHADKFYNALLTTANTSMSRDEVARYLLDFLRENYPHGYRFIKERFGDKSLFEKAAIVSKVILGCEVLFLFTDRASSV